MQKKTSSAKMKFLVLISVLFCFFLSFCAPESCFEETIATVKVIFYDTAGVARTADSITVYGIGADTTELYKNEKKVKAALLPLDASDGNSSFVVRINGVSDTITFNYTSFPHLISQECGYAFYHTLIDSIPYHSTNIIKWINLRNRNITTTNEENIRVYY